MSDPNNGGTVAVIAGTHPHVRLLPIIACSTRLQVRLSTQEAIHQRSSEERWMARKFFDHEQFNFEFQCALGGVHYGAGDVGEMLSTADRVVDGDADSWCQEWIATAQRLVTVAEGCASSGHQVSARAMLFERGVPFRHDWEHVITPSWTFCSPVPT